MNTPHIPRRLSFALCTAALVAACAPPAPLEDVVTDARVDVRNDVRSASDVVSADVVSDVTAQDSATDSAVDDAADAMPDALADATPDALADALADATPDAMPDAARPDATPDAMPDARSDAMPDALPDATPDALPDATPDASPDATPDAATDTGVADSGIGAPVVVSTTPADGASAHATSIAITFSTPMQPTSLTAQTSSGACAGSVQLSRDNFASCEGFSSAMAAMSAGGTVATLTPRPGLLANRTYKIRVTTAARNVAALPLSAVYTHATGFRTTSATVLNESDDAAEINYCNLQFPTTATLTSGASVPVYSRLYRPGVTEPAGAPAGVTAQLGVGPAATNPQIDAGWSWAPAMFNIQVGNDDEFSASLVAPAAAGSYRYTFRYSLDGGTRWTYCDSDGAGRNGGLDFEIANLGTLTVTP